MTVTHLENHEHAFLDANNVVGLIAVFSEDAHIDENIQAFAELIGFVKAICCCSYGKPYMGDTWDDTKKNWIETAPRVNEKDVSSIETANG
jgi:hypothetical protein